YTTENILQGQNSSRVCSGSGHDNLAPRRRGQARLYKCIIILKRTRLLPREVLEEGRGRLGGGNACFASPEFHTHITVLL
ncbi:MAG TPA: hypothetical protein PLM00_03640, partial [Spirochaetota bacterium]|nr:hypothetical protein [Spirochaetota bacterium]